MGPERPQMRADNFVLGIWDGHDAGAALVKDNRLLFAVNEERLSRRKLEVGFPTRSIRACLDFAGLRPADIRLIAASTTDPAKTLTRILPHLKEEYYLIRRRKKAPRSLDSFKKAFKYRFTELAPNPLSVHLSRIWMNARLGDMGFADYRLQWADHHSAHAAAAAFCCGLPDCLVMTLDGVGDGASGSLWSLRKEKLSPIKMLPAARSLGIFFEHVTNLMNMRELEDEGKVMALANYAYPIEDRENPLLSIIRTEGLDIVTPYTSTAMFREMKKIIWSYPSEQFAAMAQRALEKCVLALVAQGLAETGHKNIAAAGGVFSNIKINLKIAESPGVEHVYIFPHMGDGGLAIGAAMLVNYEQSGVTHYALPSLGLGPSYTPEEVCETLGQETGAGSDPESTIPVSTGTAHGADNLRFERIDSAPDTAARLILGGEIILWFQGRMEIGPRSLGYRSILARPDDRATKDRLNILLKKRVWYQPFCPSMLAEDAPALLHTEGLHIEDNPFMTMAFRVREERLDFMEGVINIDGDLPSPVCARRTPALPGTPDADQGSHRIRRPAQHELQHPWRARGLHPGGSRRHAPAGLHPLPGHGGRAGRESGGQGQRRPQRLGIERPTRRRSMKKILPATSILLLYLLLAGILLYVMDYQPKASIENMLITMMPWTLRLNFLLLAAGILFLTLKTALLYKTGPGCSEGKEGGPPAATPNAPTGLRRCLAPFDGISPAARKEILLLCTIFVGALLAVSLIPTQIHRLFYDEDIYASIGMNIGVLHQAAMCSNGLFDYGEFQCLSLLYNKDPNGWPFLMSLVFQAFGVNESYAFVLNNLLFAGSTVIVYLIVRLIGGRIFPSAVGAVAYALIPHNLVWSNTVAAEPAAAFFCGLSALFLFAYLRSRRDVFLILFVLSAPLACQIRAESSLIALWALLAVAILAPQVYMKRQTWLMGFVAFLLLTPHLLHLYAMSGHSWGAEGAKFSAEFLSNNLQVNGPYFLTNGQFPLAITALAFLGLFAARQKRLQTIVILIWFTLFWGIFLFFYAGSYHYGTDVRFALVAFMPLAILAGLGSGRLIDLLSQIRAFETNLGFVRPYAAALILLVLIFTWMPFLPMIRTVGQEAWGARFDHFYARQFVQKIPERSVVLTQNPGMFHLWGHSAIQAHVGLTDPNLVAELMRKYPNNVYFHFNFWCNAERDPNQKLCANLMSAYDMTPVATGQEQDYLYGLYRMGEKKK